MVGCTNLSENIEGSGLYIANEKDIAKDISVANMLVKSTIASFASEVYNVDKDSFWTNDTVEKTTFEDSVDGVSVICHCFDGVDSNGDDRFTICFFVNNSLYCIMGDYSPSGVKGLWNSLEDKHFSDYLIDSISAGSDLNADSSQSSTSQSSSSSSLSSYLVKGEGMYKVGSDVPSGDYMIFDNGYPNGGGYATYELSNSSSASYDDIIDASIIPRFSYIHINDGQYLSLSSCSLYSFDAAQFIDTSGEGEFRVGVDIPEGELKIIADSDYSTYSVNSSIDPTSSSTIDAGIVSGNAYVTVSSGQILRLSSCHIEQ